MLEKLKRKFVKGNIQQESINHKISEMLLIEFILKIVKKCMEINHNINYKAQKCILIEERNELQRRIEEKNLENIDVFLNELKEKAEKLNIYILSLYKDVNSDEVQNQLYYENKFISNSELNLLKKKILDIYEILEDINKNENENGINLDEIQSILENIIDEGVFLVVKSSIEHKELKDYYKMVNTKINEVIKDILCYCSHPIINNCAK